MVYAEKAAKSQGKMIDRFWKWAKEHRWALFAILAVFYVIKGTLYLTVGVALWNWLMGD